jgi:hypothetical protein
VPDLRRAAALLAALAACAPSPAPPPCERSIDGVWQSDGVVDRERIGYHFLERGGAAEGYPTFRDVPADLPPGVQAAPAVIDLVRTNGQLVGGRWLRRHELGGQRCTVAAPVRVAACAGDALVLELGPLRAPTDWTGCGKPGAAAALAGAPIDAPLVLRLRRPR